MKPKTRNIIDLILNLLIIVSTVWAVRYYFISGPDALGSVGKGCLKYFTTLSNVLVALAALIMIIFNFARLFEPGTAVPKWVSVLKYAGTNAVALTLMTVLFFLGPLAAIKAGLHGYMRMFEGNVLALHLTTPLIAIISFVFFERDNEFTFRDCFCACLPAYIYGIVYFVLVICLKVWNDWYGFTLGGKAYMIPVAVVAMFFASLAISALLRKLRRK